jgi:hypothetical protein
LQLYRSIVKVTGCDWIVDSSKFVLYGYLLQSMGAVNMHIIHLLRDPRGVAYSWTKKRLRPDTHNREYFVQESPLYSSMKWSVYNPLIETLKANAGYTRMMYEDFITQPCETVQTVLNDMGQAHRSLTFIQQGRVYLQPTHTSFGNAVRLNTGEVDVKADLEWRAKLKWQQKAIVNLVTLPRRVRYHYA